MSALPSVSLARAIASTLVAIRNCDAAGNVEWSERHRERLSDLCDLLPSGAGIDCGATLDESRSDASRLTFTVEFHHMNDVGAYDGWTSHVVTVRPTFDGIDVQVSGRNRNQIKDYLGDLFAECLRADVPTYAPR